VAVEDKESQEPTVRVPETGKLPKPDGQRGYQQVPLRPVEKPDQGSPSEDKPLEVMDDREHGQQGRVP
jgi:hypothetical protein